ncbi:MAG: hypothetical protein NT069_33135 [Planctomycetota bacterium]|nr:hypothetical protein [Planctomycetota bacterium]
MSTRFFEDAQDRAARWRAAAVVAWHGSVSAGRRNPGFALAVVSGLAGLALAIWLLLSAFFTWFCAPQSRQSIHEASERSPDDSSEIDQRLSELPRDAVDPTVNVDLHVRPSVAGHAVARKRRIPGIPLEPEFADEMPPAAEPPLRLVPEDVTAIEDVATIDDEPMEEEPRQIARFNRANPGAEETSLDDEPPAAVEDLEPEEPSEVANAAEPEPDQRLLGDALAPEFAPDAAMAWLVPTEPTDESTAELSPATEETEAAEEVVAQSTDTVPNESAEWKGVAPLPPVVTEVVTEQSDPVETRIIVAEPTPTFEPVVRNPSPQQIPEKPVAPPPPVKAPKLALRWEPLEWAQVGRISTMVLLVSNIGDAPASNVDLELKLPGDVGHPEGHDLEQTLPRLNPGEVERIPLIIRPAARGEMRIPVVARSGAVEAQSTGVLRVGESPRNSSAKRAAGKSTN